MKVRELQSALRELGVGTVLGDQLAFNAWSFGAAHGGRFIVRYDKVSGYSVESL